MQQKYDLEYEDFRIASTGGAAKETPGFVYPLFLPAHWRFLPCSTRMPLESSNLSNPDWSQRTDLKASNSVLRWRIASQVLELGQSRPKVVMGILNVTPDSFSDGGKLGSVQDAVDAAMAMVGAGATIIDVGGESTRPGAAPVPTDVQIERTAPVITGLRTRLAEEKRDNIIISIDTTREPVARAALTAGAHIINDVSGGEEDPTILNLAARSGAGLILMHRLTRPQSDSYSDSYITSPVYPGGVVSAVLSALRDHLLPRAHAAGVDPDAILIDPGLGFGKSPEDNLRLINATAALRAVVGRPLLSGLSRKSFVGRVSLQRESTPDERLPGTLALSALHSLAGADVFRVHDVAPHVQALAALSAAASSAVDGPFDAT